MIPDEEVGPEMEPDEPQAPDAAEDPAPPSEVPIDPATGCCYKSGEVPLGKSEPIP